MAGNPLRPWAAMAATLRLKLNTKFAAFMRKTFAAGRAFAEIVGVSGSSVRAATRELG
jgi:hypothetical protein